MDLGRPVALTRLGITGQVSGADRTAERVSALLSALSRRAATCPPSDGTDTDEALNRAVEAYHQQSAQTRPRRRRRKSPRGSPVPMR
ncbi:SAM-dependent methyltransferase [Streptomyces sp. SMS_SU21]|nr:SAM-dependent methyltransferase [Streptomyces sp. SMS_SU21]